MAKVNRSIGARRGKFVAKQNHPAALEAKATIRRNVMAALGCPANVFDAFAGSGEMFGAVWKNANTYIGCDLKWPRDGRLIYASDNRRVLRSIDLKGFNVFDLDAYGFPWEQAIIIADRRPVMTGERLGMIFTEGGGMAYKANTVPTAMTVLAGVRSRAVGLGRKREAITDRAIAGLAKRMRCTIEKRWQAKGTTGAIMLYVGVVLRGM